MALAISMTYCLETHTYIVLQNVREEEAKGMLCLWTAVVLLTTYLWSIVECTTTVEVRVARKPVDDNFDKIPRALKTYPTLHYY